MSDTKAEATGVEAATLPSAPAKRSFGARVAAHYKKWWWAHLIAFVIVVLVVVLPVIYVGYPKIAQRDVNDSTLDITSMVISDPTPDSFQLNQTQVIGSDSSYHPQIYAFNAAVSLAGAAAPFTTVRVPGVKSEDGAEIEVVQKVDLSDVDAFGDYAKAVMLNEEVSLNIYGEPELRQGSLPKTKVTYNKTVTMKGLNQLKGFDVTEFHILLTTKNGRNMDGTVYIPNPSVMTIEMGNLTLDLSVAGKPMGQSFLDNLILKPGNNTIPMTSTVNQTAIISMLTSKSNPYKDGVVPFDITGNSSVYNGKTLPYFTEALSANNLTVHLNVTKALAEIGLTNL
ncbi:hypothetical protein N7532_004445 [Penicillium argentinense]|uniref:Uncharacterized protein n=1 Tax=Penicillium argentinense TaxID=1131581 RepID=A0A9W9FPD1_9EURO|nr:uncharacterized protein N7532_004445 [Penicillium argentinense]KAJ5103916.1 hypothetical protein N7532_004445 [Penicillium argentinense]